MERERTRRASHPAGIFFRLHVYYDPENEFFSKSKPFSWLYEELGLSKEKFIDFILQEIPVDQEIAEKLAAFCHTSPELWLNLQKNYDKYKDLP